MIYTKQEAFDKAARGVIQQGRAAKVGYYGACAYLTPDGLKCGVGHLLPEDTPEDLWKFSGSILNSNTAGQRLRALLAATASDETFLSHLQAAHDGADGDSRYFLRDFRENMRKIAVRYLLDPAVLYEQETTTA